MKISLHLTRRTILALLAVSVIGTAAAATTLFTHTFPVIPASPPVIVTTCSTLTATPDAIITGSSGSIILTCGTGPAFTVTLPGQATPTFPPLQAGVSLNIQFHPASPGCGGGFMSSGTPITFGTASVGRGYDYCETFDAAPPSGIPATTVTWSQ